MEFGAIPSHEKMVSYLPKVRPGIILEYLVSHYLGPIGNIVMELGDMYMNLYMPISLEFSSHEKPWVNVPLRVLDNSCGPIGEPYHTMSYKANSIINSIEK